MDYRSSLYRSSCDGQFRIEIFPEFQFFVWIIGDSVTKGIPTCDFREYVTAAI